MSFSTRGVYPDFISGLARRIFYFIVRLRRSRVENKYFSTSSKDILFYCSTLWRTISCELLHARSLSRFYIGTRSKDKKEQARRINETTKVHYVTFDLVFSGLYNKNKEGKLKITRKVKSRNSHCGFSTCPQMLRIKRCRRASSNNKKILISGLVFTLVFGGVFGVLPQIAKAADPTATSGKAKMMNTGEYLYFDAAPYGSNVTVSDPDPGDSNRRTLAGYSWSTDFGWINFGDAVHGGPVKVTYATGDLTGQAYALNTGGFIDFDAYNSNAYIDTTTGEFKGYGWSNDGGWVNFEDTGARVDEEGKPNNPTATHGYSSAAKTLEYTSGNWGMASGPAGPYFEWSGATDTAGTSGYALGVDGYWVYFGTDPTAEPTTAGAYQTAATYTNSASLVAGSTYYLRIRTKDKVGNLFTPADTSEYTKFIYSYDPTAPDAPEYINVSPAGCSTQANFTFTWPAVVDPISDTAGYQYKRGSTGTVQDLGNVLTTATTAYQEGDNVFYLRTVDNAGNTSVWQTAVYCSTGIVHIADGPNVIAGPSSIAVTWVSDKQTTGYVQVYEGNSYVSEQGHTSYSMSHAVTVVGLKSERAYRYKLVWTDSSGNLGESSWYNTTTAEKPQIINLRSEIISPSQVLIIWGNNYSATSKIEYGIGNYDTVVTISGEATNSTKYLSGLAGGSDYRLRVSADTSDGTEFSAGITFSTPPLPAISSLRFEPVAESAQPAVNASWTTNVETTSTIYYGAKGEGRREISQSDKVKEHKIKLENLSDNTTYEAYVLGIDNYGNIAKSDINSFITSLDTRPPKIENIIVETSNVGLNREDTAQAVVSYQTDEPAKCTVEYARGISGDSYDNKTADEEALITGHINVISDLVPRTPYHLRVICLDKSNNRSQSSGQTITSGEVQESIFNIILKTLNSLFGWLKIL